MVTGPILASAPDVLNVTTDSYDKLAGYAAFRRIQDDWEEAPRPSIDDVESVAAVLRDSLAASFGQDSATFHDSEPLTGEWASRVGFEGAGQIRHDTNEGRTHQLILSPGTLRLTSFDARARAATEERALVARGKRAGSLARFCAVAGCPVFDAMPAGAPGSEVREWSRRSRGRMVETLAALDYSSWLSCGGTLAMLTLTLPGNWEVLTPSGADFKRLVRTFEQRWRRARTAPLVHDFYSELFTKSGLREDFWRADPSTRMDWRGLWKLEFQRRGAPHWHGLVRLPVFVYSSGGYNPKHGYEVQEMVHEFISRTWAEVVGASREVDGLDADGNETSEYLRHLAAGTGIDFSGKDFSDPRRISMYFLGHSVKSQDGKEYQHRVPELWRRPGKGPGRFWGVVGLNKALARVTVTDTDMIRLKRIARKVKAARDWKVNVLREQGAAFKAGAAVPGAFEVQRVTRGRRPVKGEVNVRRGVWVPEHLEPLYVTGNGRAALRTRNRDSLAASLLGYKDVPPAVGIGPVRRVSTLVLVPPAYQTIGKDGRIGEGPDHLVPAPWVRQRRAAYAPFSGGQGGFVLVNDALKLGLDIARYLGQK